MSDDKRTLKHWKNRTKDLEIKIEILENDRNKLRKWEKISIMASIAIVFVTACNLMVMCNQTNVFKEQSKIFEKQTKIIKHQDSLFELQIDESKLQNHLITSQNDIIKIQSDNSEDQNILLGRQNDLLKNQNIKIDKQSNLLEADRRSSLNILFNSLIEKIDSELTMQSNKENKFLSDLTIERIVTLSISFKPYYRNSDGQSEQLYLSPERGQLLLFLINANLNTETYKTIFKKGNFQYSDLQNTYINDFDFSFLNLSYSNFDDATLNSVKFSGVNLKGTTFLNSKIEKSTFVSSKILSANFTNSKIFNTKFLMSSLIDVNFSDSLIRDCIFHSREAYIKYPINNFKTFDNFVAGTGLVIGNEMKINAHTGDQTIVQLINKFGNRNKFFDESTNDINSRFLYKKLNFKGTVFYKTEFIDVIIEQSNFSTCTMEFLRLQSVGLYNCDLKNISTNLFTLYSFFYNLNLNLTRNKVYRIKNFIDQPININRIEQKQLLEYLRKNFTLNFSNDFYLGPSEPDKMSQLFSKIIIDIN